MNANVRDYTIRVCQKYHAEEFLEFSNEAWLIMPNSSQIITSYIYIYIYIWIELSVAVKRVYVNNNNWDS